MCIDVFCEAAQRLFAIFDFVKPFSSLLSPSLSFLKHFSNDLKRYQCFSSIKIESKQPQVEERLSYHTRVFVSKGFPFKTTYWFLSSDFFRDICLYDDDRPNGVFNN